MTANDQIAIDEIETSINIANQVCSNLKSRVAAPITIQGGFQLEFVSISQVINHMTCYNLSALIG